MNPSSLQFFKSLLQTPSPPGYERPVQELVRAWAKQYTPHVTTDRHGNVIAVLNPGQEQRIMLAGHCDQLSLMVQYIDNDGFLYVQPMGGWDMQVLLGSNLLVWTKNGSIPGVVARKAPHLMTSEEKNKVPHFHDIWVDIGVKDKKEAEELVHVGDTVTLVLGLREMRNQLVTAPGMDDKSGVWVVFETLRLLHNVPLQCSVYFVSTVQEEIGLRGAATSSYGIHPTVGIAVDVTHSTDTPGSEKKSVGECSLGKGPVLSRGPNSNHHVYHRLVAAAETKKIAVQRKAHNKATGTDANAIQLSRDGVAAGLVGIPNRYMHSPVEMVDLGDLIVSSELLAEFCKSIRTEDDWTP
ncbi:MAG TPA: M42 family metallopeptidase [Gemmatales bacterium]|nr:M42 family metallopeptidase [Gemmatales bacterium]